MSCIKHSLNVSIFLMMFFSAIVISLTVTAEEVEPILNDDDLSYLDFDEDTTEWLEIEQDVPTGTRYMLYENYGGFWADAEKEPGSDGVGNSPPVYEGEDDDLLCWAATCSNMLEWSGWGFVDGMDNADDFFQYYQDHVTDDGHFVGYGLDWWFDGTLEVLDIGGSVEKEDPDHLGFWITTHPYDYITDGIYHESMMPNICNNIMDGNIVGLGIYPMSTRGGHAVTCWGFNYDPSYDPVTQPDEYYLGIWLTDSDTHKNMQNPPDTIRYYEVNQTSAGKWYMPNYGDGWIILKMTSLLPYPLEDRPVADAWGPYSGDEGDSVTFYATRSYDPQTTSDPLEDSLSYRWDFNGDGTWDTEWLLEDTANYICDESFSGTVYLEVFDGRLRDMDTAEFTLNNVPPTVDAGDDIGTNEGDPVVFHGSISDPGGDDGPYSIDWDFGDGSPAEHALDLKHKFCNAGTYTVTLTVIDKDGGVGSDTLTVEVNNLPPVVDAGFNRYVEQGETVYFNGAIYDPGTCDSHNCGWDFNGDGTDDVTDTLTPTHIYYDEGTYEVSFWAADDNGKFDSDSMFVYVSGTSFTVDAGPDQTVNQNDEVVFSGSYSGNVNDILYKHWDFGDGIIIEGELFPTHRYCGHKTYTATLMITDVNYNTVRDTVHITVLNVAPTVDAGDDQTVFLGETVDFAGSFDEPGCDLFTIEWDFGDGSPIVTDTLTPTHIYTTEGTYSVTLTVTDDDDGVGDDTLQITALNSIPVVDAGPDQTVNEGELVSFSGSYTDHDSESWDKYWIFGDGDWITDTLTTTHVFCDNDLYTVLLIVIDNDGNIGYDTIDIDVQNVDPEISSIELYQPNPNYILPEIHTLEFTAIFSDAGTFDVFDISWDFGDGTSETGPIVEHVYSNPGSYTVTLTVTDDDGGSDTYTITVNVISSQTLSEDINEYIQNTVPDSAFKKDPDGKRISLQEMLVDDPDSVVNLVNAGLYDEALEKLDMIRAKMDGLPKPKDWIVDQYEQTYLCGLIDELILYINTLT